MARKKPWLVVANWSYPKKSPSKRLYFVVQRVHPGRVIIRSIHDTRKDAESMLKSLTLAVPREQLKVVAYHRNDE